MYTQTYASDANLYIHAKVIDVDPGYPDERVDIGSQNFSWGSLEYNRELGLDLGPAQNTIIKSVAATVQSDLRAPPPGLADNERQAGYPLLVVRPKTQANAPLTGCAVLPPSCDERLHSLGPPVLEAGHPL